MDNEKVTQLILKHIDGGFNDIEDGTWKVIFEGREDDDGNITTPEQDQQDGWSRFIVENLKDNKTYYVLWDYPSKSITEVNEG
tara:strand:- start:2 stop:250 length:249 start_codon:yes stop_codon:yes gene_type:complete